nr:helix-turn-helix domain containing protein [Bacillus pumilus]
MHCARTILEEGLSQLTLQQVAEHAHMTKAGLLYHFASKEELIQKMNEHAILCFRQLTRNVSRNLQA